MCAVGKAVRQKGIARYGRSHEDRYRPEHRLKDKPRYVCRTAVRGAAVGETSQREALSERDSEKADNTDDPNRIPKKRYADDLSGIPKKRMQQPQTDKFGKEQYK